MYIMEKGNPYEISVASLVKQFKKSPQMICRDLIEVKKEMADELGKDVKSLSHCGFTKQYRELMKSGNWEEASRVLERMNKFLFNVGAVEKVAEKIDLGDSRMTADALGNAAREVRDEWRRQGVEDSSSEEHSGKPVEGGREESEQDEQGSEGKLEEGDK